jgi:hypothetical protein
MGFPLPASVINTTSAYFYADTSFALGPLVMQPSDAILVIVDYSLVTPTIMISTYTFTVDTASNPPLIVAYDSINAAQNVLTFLVTGGLTGQQYNISIKLNGTARIDTLTVNIPSGASCCPNCGQLTSSGGSSLPNANPYVNDAPRYTYSATDPIAPNLMDQWWNTTTKQLMEWTTPDGTNFTWTTVVPNNLVLEAPTDGKFYARQNSGWAVDPIQSDAPDAQTYSRTNGAWVINAFQDGDAPLDNQLYGRRLGTWQVVPPQVITTDAPSDGAIYGRLNSGWTSIPAHIIFTDAPDDGNAYVRSNSTWQSGGTFTGSLVTQGSLTATGGAQIGTTLTVGGVATFGAQVALAYDPIQPLQAATKQYVDLAIVKGQGICFISDTPPASPTTGMLWFDSVALQLYTWYDDGTSSQWVPTDPGVPVEEAPVDGQVYGRQGSTRTWLPVPHLFLQDTAPTNPAHGAIWATTLGQLLIFNGQTSHWIQYAGASI